jgi:hypothetical protein
VLGVDFKRDGRYAFIRGSLGKGFVIGLQKKVEKQLGCVVVNIRSESIPQLVAILRYFRCARTCTLHSAQV